MKIHETTKADGTLAAIALRASDEALSLEAEGESLPLPNGALEAVMARFAKSLDPEAKLVEVDTLVLPGSCRLRHVRHLATYDVIALDYLVYERPNSEPLCALATVVAGALGHLAHAARAAKAHLG